MKTFLQWVEVAGMVGTADNENMPVKSKYTAQDTRFKMFTHGKKPRCMYLGDCPDEKKGKTIKFLEI
jgi:hypothetical protein